jgi:hypothetical protein
MIHSSSVLAVDSPSREEVRGRGEGRLSHLHVEHAELPSARVPEHFDSCVHGDREVVDEAHGLGVEGDEVLAQVVAEGEDVGSIQEEGACLGHGLRIG